VHFTISDHWLRPAEHISSPNCDARPDEATLDLIVIHNISLPPKQYGNGYIQQFFCNELDCQRHPYFLEIKDLRVSAHLLIQRNGAVTQFVPFDKRAWHAGESNYKGRTVCNNFSIGIELEGADDEPYADNQYHTLTGVVRCLLHRYDGLSAEAIVGHSDIAPNRKTDPGPAFDWQRFRSALIA